MIYLSLCFLTPFLFLLLAKVLKADFLRSLLGPLLTVVFIGFMISQGPQMTALERLLAASLWLLYFIKGWSLLKIPHQELAWYSPIGLLLYSFLWPGVDPKPFAQRQSPQTDKASWFALGFPTACIGIAGAIFLAFFASSFTNFWIGILGLLCILTTVHLGYSDVLSSLASLAGFPVSRLFPLMYQL